MEKNYKKAIIEACIDECRKELASLYARNDDAERLGEAIRHVEDVIAVHQRKLKELDS